MLEEQGIKKEIIFSDPLDFSKLHEEGHCRRLITQLYNEINAKDARIKGVQALTLILNEKEEKCKRMEDMAKNYELTLKRAEARIAQLNKMFGIGPQTAFNRGVVMPGASKKDLDLVTQENLKLKKALEHIVPTELRGQAVILKNKELSDLVAALQEDLAQSETLVQQFELALRNKENGNNYMVPELTKDMLKLKRSLNAKQVFCETLIKENDRLKKLLEEVNDLKEQEEDKRDSVDGRNQKEGSYVPEFEVLAIREKLDETMDENRMLRERVEKNENMLLDYDRKIKKLVEERNTSMKEFTELQNVFTELQNVAAAQKTRESEHRMIAQEIEKLSKENTEYKKKCDGFFKQVVSMNSKQKESEEEADRMKRASEHQTAELEEKKALNNLMSESLKSYEDDFRREYEEKAKFQQMVDKARQEGERTKRENQSHMATIRHLEDEFERLNKMLNDERKRANDMKSKVSPSPLFGLQNPYSALQAAGTRSFMPENRPMQVVTDGGGINESDNERRQDPYSMPTTKSETSSAPSLIECPYCSRSYPYHLIEGHVQDCMEDSLYLDEKD